MKRILMSLLMVITIGALTAGATRAYFSDTASVTQNTFATGTLEIRVNDQPSIAGYSFTPIAPGGQTIWSHNVANGWSSNLIANKLLLNITSPNDFESGLWSVVNIKVEASRDNINWYQAYSGPINGLHDVDLLMGWLSLTPGTYEYLRYTLTLPETGDDQSALMGKTMTWNFAIEGRTN